MHQAPLAERIRPRELTDFIGQSHLIGKKGIISKQLEQGVLPSMIIWGPPGSGKTTLAQLISTETERPFHELSAINHGVKDLREVIQKAKNGGSLFAHQKPFLFIDEIHRFSKSQQDSLLQAVEKGWVTLIGATTENPSFEIISALLSRCQVYSMKELGKTELEQILKNAITKDSILQQKKIKILETEALIRISGGDARKLLNALEVTVMNNLQKEIQITNALVMKNIQENIALYDKNGEQHYDIISAFIKSIRGSDPNAAVYWLARMLMGGEDIKFIARRLLILASEDIGNANPTALVLANNTFQAIQVIGMPEARIILSQCATYLASSPKSNASYLAINHAQKLVKDTGDLSVPLPIRNAPTQLMKELEYGKEGKYPHDFDGNFVTQEYLPKEIENTKLYDPGLNKREAEIRKFLKDKWKSKYQY